MTDAVRFEAKVSPGRPFQSLPAPVEPPSVPPNARIVADPPPRLPAPTPHSSGPATGLNRGIDPSCDRRPAYRRDIEAGCATGLTSLVRLHGVPVDTPVRKKKPLAFVAEQVATAATATERRQWLEVARVLLRLGGSLDPATDGPPLLSAFVLAGDLESTRALVEEHGVSPDNPAWFLGDAIASAPEELSVYLLEQIAPSPTPALRDELFQFAVYRGRLEVVARLLRSGADAFAPLGAHSESAVQWVIEQSGEYRSDEIPHLPERQDQLTFARETRAQRFGGPLLRLLLESSEDRGEITRDGERYLGFAVWEACDAGLVDYLCTHGADPNRGEVHGQSFLHTALVQGDWHTAKALLKHGARITDEDRALASALDEGNSSRSFVQLLETRK